MFIKLFNQHESRIDSVVFHDIFFVAQEIFQRVSIGASNVTLLIYRRYCSRLCLTYTTVSLFLLLLPLRDRQKKWLWFWRGLACSVQCRYNTCKPFCYFVVSSFLNFWFAFYFFFHLIVVLKTRGVAFLSLIIIVHDRNPWRNLIYWAIQLKTFFYVC